MEALSKHIVISLIILLIFLVFLLVSNRLYTKRQLRIQQSQQLSEVHPTDISDISGASPQWQRVPGTISRSQSGGPLRFIPSPQGDVIVRIPVGLWQSQQTPNALNNNRTSRQERTGTWVETPSVWGIDLDHQARYGDAILVPAPGGLVLSSTTRGPARWGRRRAVDEEAGFFDGECLPRYEGPPPGYEKVLEEGGAAPGSADRPGEGGSQQAVSRNSGQDVRGDEILPIEPTPPEPAVTRERPAI